MTTLTRNNIIDSFHDKLTEKENEQKSRTRNIKQNYPSIRKILDDISDYNINAIINNTDKASFVKENNRLYSILEDELETNGFDRNYLNIDYNCPKCNDTGFIDGKMCSCLKTYLDEHKKQTPVEKRIGSFEEFDETLFSDSTDKFKLSPRKNALRNRQTALNFANNFEDQSSYLGLYMTGTVGSGKTFLANAVAKLVERKGFDVLCLTAKEFEDTIKNFSSPDYEKNKNHMAQCDLLIIDDLGIETKSEFVNNEILMLLDYRMTYGLKMIITTNISMKELRDIYKSRIYSRIASNFTRLSFYGGDIRIARRLKNK